MSKSCISVMIMALFLIVGMTPVTFSTGTLFNPATSMLVGTYPTCVATGDLNNDGHLDLVTANESSSNLSVNLGYGNGSFMGRINYDLLHALRPYSVAISDMNGDNNPDLITSGWNGFQILYGAGDGTFGTPFETPLVGSNQLVVEDFNNDNLPDIALTNSYDSMSIFINNGDSTFTVTFLQMGRLTNNIIAGKLDIDSYIDLAVTSNDGTIWNLKNNGSGNFTPIKVDSLTCQSCFAFELSVTAADFFDNGISDLAVASWANDSVYIYLNNGNGTYQKVYTYQVGLQPRAIIAKDFDADTTVDLIVSNYTDMNVQFLKGYGQCIFSPDSTYPVVGGGPRGLVSGDFDEDSYLDLAVASPNDNQVYIFVNALDLSLSVDDISTGNKLPQTFILKQNYPNPFNPETKIQFMVPTSSNVKIDVLNILGQSVRTLVDERLSPGTKEVTWDGLNDNGLQVASGLYFYRIITDNFVDTKKMVLLR